MNGQHLAVFQNMPVFGGLSEESLDYLIEKSYTQVIEAEAYLFRENDKGDAMYIIESGKVAVLKQWKDKEYI